jgi:hypothetical protein
LEVFRQAGNTSTGEAKQFIIAGGAAARERRFHLGARDEIISALGSYSSEDRTETKLTIHSHASSAPILIMGIGPLVTDWAISKGGGGFKIDEIISLGRERERELVECIVFIPHFIDCYSPGEV